MASQKHILTSDLHLCAACSHLRVGDDSCFFLAAVRDGAKKRRMSAVSAAAVRDGDASAGFRGAGSLLHKLRPVEPARRSSPGGVQVSSSAAPQTQARMMLDLIARNCLFDCVSMSEMPNFYTV